MKDDIINLMVADLIAKAADIETRFWNDQHSFVKCFEEKKQLCREFTKSFVAFMDKRIAEQKTTQVTESIKVFGSEQKFAEQVYKNALKWIERHPDKAQTLEFELITGAAVFAFSRIDKLKRKRKQFKEKEEKNNG